MSKYFNTNEENPLRYFSHIELDLINENLKKEAEYIKNEIIKESAKDGNRITIKQLSPSNEEYLILNGFSVIPLTTEYLVSWPKKVTRHLPPTPQVPPAQYIPPTQQSPQQTPRMPSYREPPTHTPSFTNPYSSMFDPNSTTSTLPPNQSSSSFSFNPLRNPLDMSELQKRVNNIANLTDRLVNHCNGKTSGTNYTTNYSNQIFDFTKPDMYKK